MTESQMIAVLVAIPDLTVRERRAQAFVTEYGAWLTVRSLMASAALA